MRIIILLSVLVISMVLLGACATEPLPNVTPELAPAYASEFFNSRGPYIAALVVFDDAPDFRLPTNLIDCQPEDVHIGMPLEAVFQKVDDRITMPVFRPLKAKTP